MVQRAAGGAGGSTSFEALQKADALWHKLRHAKVHFPAVMLLAACLAYEAFTRDSLLVASLILKATEAHMQYS